MGKQARNSHPYLEQGLIAYIGNKRRLRHFLGSVFDECERVGGITSFLDPFCGSGAVARLAKFRGWSVCASDLEPYSVVLNKCYLCCDTAHADYVLSGFGGLRAAIAHLNRVGAHARDSGSPAGYLGENYAPARTDSFDLRFERLFFTAENARFFDAVRDEIEQMCPTTEQARSLLLAPLLYEVSVHSNTSGVFKAYHNGFGGHGRDALGRILAHAELEVPELIVGPGADICRADAADRAGDLSSAGRGVDIAYLDPPYNMHQYGSNYFMLNTVVHWDKQPVDNSIGPDGRLRRKAGIREDWVRTRSEYCSKRTVAQAFAALLDNLDARHIVVSYNTEGIMPFEELCDLLASHGQLRIRTCDYTQYRGGRQSAARRNSTMEIALIVDREGIRFRETSGAYPRKVKAAMRVIALCKGAFVPSLVADHFGEPKPAVEIGGKRLHFVDGYRLHSIPALEDLTNVELTELEDVENRLAACSCGDNAREADVLKSLLEGEVFSEKDRKTYETACLAIARKLAHPKYRGSYESLMDWFCSDPERCRRHERALAALTASAGKRLGPR